MNYDARHSFAGTRDCQGAGRLIAGSAMQTDDVQQAGPQAPADGDEPGDRQFVTALARGLEVLACFRARDRSLGNQDIARRCGLPKSTVSRLTHTLTRLGYLSQDRESGRYRLGSATLALGSRVLANMDMRQLARPLMQELADATGTMVSLGVRDRLSMIYVENCRSPSALTLSLDVGSRIPLGSTAMGRAWLAVAPPREREALLEELAAQHGPNWGAQQSAIERALQQYRELGCACSFGDWQPDVNAIAVGIDPGHGMPRMAINCGGPAFQLSPQFLLEQARPRLLAMVRRLQQSARD